MTAPHSLGRHGAVASAATGADLVGLDQTLQDRLVKSREIVGEGQIIPGRGLRAAFATVAALP